MHIKQILLGVIATWAAIGFMGYASGYYLAATTWGYHVAAMFWALNIVTTFTLVYLIYRNFAAVRSCLSKISGT